MDEKQKVSFIDRLISTLEEKKSQAQELVQHKIEYLNQLTESFVKIVEEEKEFLAKNAEDMTSQLD